VEQQEEQPSELSNNEVTVTVNRRPRCVVELRVKAKPSLTGVAHKEAVKEVAKEVALPGFRKGRAPEALVLKNFSEAIKKRWHEVVANKAYNASAPLTQAPKLQSDTKILFDMQTCSLEEGATLSLSYETLPDVPSVDPQQITLRPVKRPEVNEQKVEETIRQLRLFFAEWTRVEDRPAQEGDFVLIDLDVIEGNSSSSLFSNTRFEVSDHAMAQWMKALIIGLRIGDSVEGVSRPDDTLSEEEKAAFQLKEVRLTLHGIDLAALPPLDDRFAQRVGVATVEDLRTQVTRLLNHQADAHVKKELRDQLDAYLLEHYPFDLPDSIVEQEASFRMRQVLADKDFQEHFTSSNAAERKAILEEILEHARRALRMFYLSKKIAQEAGIEISLQDLPQPAATPLEALMRPAERTLTHADESVQLAEAYSRTLLEKAEDYLIAHAKTVA
jgi:trigger factor